MLPALKAEFRKLFTVRTTYFLTGFVALFILFFAGYISGFRGDAAALGSSNFFVDNITGAWTFAAIFCGIIAILLFSHEYRYNIIMHTLTSSNSRTKILLAKIIAMTGFALVFMLVMGALSPLAAYVGAHLAGHDIGSQSIPFSDLLWRGSFFVWGYAMIGLILVALTRNQIASVVAMLLIPSTLEGIVGLLLKHNAIYLPFSSLNAVISNSPDITHQKAAFVFLVYLVGLWITAWLLFLRRDAN